MRTLLHILAVSLLVAIVATACSNVGCTDNQNSLPYAAFYSGTTQEGIVPDSIEIGGVGAPGDSLLIDAGDQVSALYLPFRAGFPSVSFFIRYRAKALDLPQLVDTMTFQYESRPFFASEDCGAMYHYYVTDVRYTRHLLDSVVMADPLITNVEREYIRIYFRTADPDAPEDRPVTPGDSMPGVIIDPDLVPDDTPASGDNDTETPSTDNNTDSDEENS